MQIFKEQLLSESKKTGFRPEILEKVWYLMNVLERINEHSFLKERLVLKGGTALNLFVFDLPRLSVDIDLNYIGKVDREGMLSERSEVDRALEAVFGRENLVVERIPGKHAGGKWRLKYKSALGNQGNLEVDLNYMFRVPLWDVVVSSSTVAGSYQIHNIRILNHHELGAGKLSALFSRNAARDIFDAHHLMVNTELDIEQLRLAFIIYLCMGSIANPLEISPDSIQFDEREFRQKLMPVVPSLQNDQDLKFWKTTKFQECKEALTSFSLSERMRKNS